MPIRRTTLRGAVAAAALAALVAPTAPALAQSHVTHDAKRDVTHFSDADENGVVDPTRTEGDVTGLGVNYTKHRVYLALQYAQLTRPAGDDTFLVHGFSLRTSKKRVYNLTVFGGADGSGRDLIRGNGRSVKCHGLRTHTSYADDLVTASIPRSCLGSPRWVRVGAYGVSSDSDDLDDYVDDASRSGVRDNLTYGPRVHSGARRSSVGSS